LPDILKRHGSIVAPPIGDAVLHRATVDDFGFTELELVGKGDESNHSKPVCEDEEHTKESY